MKVKYVGRLFDNTYRVNTHSHPFWEVVYYTHGAGQVMADGHNYPFCAGDVFVIPPGTVHHDTSDSGFRNYHYTFLDIDFTARGLLRFRDTEKNDFLVIIKQLYTEFHLKREGWQKIVASLYDVLYQYIAAFSKQAAHNEYVAILQDRLIRNIANCGYRPEECYHLVPVCPDHMRRLFFRQLGCTPLQYLTKKRLEYACSLLQLSQSGELPLSEIAYRSGFADYAYFSRLFKRENGLSPREYQKKLRA